MKLKNLMELNTSITINLPTTKKLTIKATKGNRIYIGFLELIFGIKYDPRTSTLDLSSLNEDITIVYNDHFKEDEVHLIHDIDKVSKILEAGILNKLDNYFLVRKSVHKVELSNYEKIDIQSVMLILAHYDAGISDVLLSEDVSEKEKKEIIVLRTKFYDICRKYFEMSGDSLERFGMDGIVTFVSHVMN